MYSSGSVLFRKKEHPPLPIRILSEFFQRAYFDLNQPVEKPCVLYDPMCGSAANITVLKYMHWNLIKKLIGSDVENDSLEVAKLNIGLLTLDGIDDRIDKLNQDYKKFGKDSHKIAIESAKKLREIILDDVDHQLFLANATEENLLEKNLAGNKIDIVLFDIPYGELSDWKSSDLNKSKSDSIALVLDNIYPFISNGGIAVVFTPKHHTISQSKLNRYRKEKIGNREIFMLRKE